jgi:hypothetical protein
MRDAESGRAAEPAAVHAARLALMAKDMIPTPDPVEPDVSTYALSRGETLFELTKPAEVRTRAVRTQAGEG